MSARSSLRRTPTLRVLAAVGLAGVVALFAAGCGADTEESGGSAEPTVVEIVFEGDSVTLNGGETGQRIAVDAGAPIDIEVTADEPGELHLHTSEEQELAYGEGTETFPIQIDRPGVVEVESHELDLLIAQLEVE